MSDNRIGIPEPRPDLASLVRSVQALREQVQILVGDKGDPMLDKAVTLRDLADLGIITLNVSSDWEVTDIVKTP